MATALLRFRCYKCDKLLGTSASRAGKTTTCPNCKAELIVPRPESTPDGDLADAARLLIPGLADTSPEAEPKHDPGFSWEQIDTAIFRSGAAVEPDPISFPIEPEPEPSLPEPAVEAPALIVTPLPPLNVSDLVGATGGTVLPEINVEVPPVRSDIPSRPRARAGEVLLSQAVLVSWSLFVLLALAISFLAGLFVGHYVWKAG